MIILILLLIIVVVIYFNPFFDYYIDYTGKKHLVLWYNNFKNERKFINLIGSQY